MPGLATDSRRYGFTADDGGLVMNAYHTNRYCERLLSMYKATNDNHVRHTIDTEWRAAWSDLLRQHHERTVNRLRGLA